ncbi:hypothetical protein ACFL54_07560 [Planctomycetota bacterium]
MTINTDWKIQKPGNFCFASGRELKEGEVFYACLYDEATGNGASLGRRDYSLEHWPGAQDKGLFSYWKSKVPLKKDKKNVIDTVLLENLFMRLLEEQDSKKRAFCFLIALMLMRKKVLKFEDSFQQGEEKFLVLRHVPEKRNITIHDPKLSPEEIDQVREELSALLQSDLSE